MITQTLRAWSVSQSSQGLSRLLSVQQVASSSWLYNRKAYTRLFPPSFGASAKVDKRRYRFRGLWGQRLRHDLTANEWPMEAFLERIQRLHAEQDMASCFPWLSVVTLTPVGDCYNFSDQ